MTAQLESYKLEMRHGLTLGDKHNLKIFSISHLFLE